MKMINKRRLHRVNKNKMLFGVCSGLSEYFDVDVTLIRIIWIIFFFTGAGFLAYLLCALVMPGE